MEQMTTDSLQNRLDELVRRQEVMKEVNAYYREKGTVIGCPCLSAEEAQELDEDTRRRYPMHKVPYPQYCLTNNSAAIRRLRAKVDGKEPKLKEKER